MSDRAPIRDRLGRIAGSRWTLATILVLAGALRVAHVLALRKLPLFDSLIVDSQYYDSWAKRIAAGDWLGGPRAFFFDPLYTYVLAVLYRVVGRDLLVIRLLQVGLGVGTCWLVAVIGCRVGGKAVGNLAALFVALYKPAIFQEGEVEKTALGVFLITAVLALAMRESIRARLAAGVVLGLAALTRGNMLLMAPLGALYFLAEDFPPTALTGGRRRWRERLLGRPGRSALALVLGVSAVLAPVAWRNHYVSGEWIPTTAGAGTNFYTGNNPANGSGGFEYVPFVRPQSGHEEDDFLAEAQRRTGRVLGPSELSSYWLREALHHIANHPRFAAMVDVSKFVLSWSNLEMPDAWDMYFLARYSPVLSFPLLGMACLLPLAVLGAFASFRVRREVRMLVGYVAAYSATLVAFYVFSRYRLYVLPALAVLGAAGAFWVADVIRARDLRRGLAAFASALTVALFSLYATRAFGISRTQNTTSFVNLAGLYAERGQFVPAEALLFEALEKESGRGRAGPLCALGELHLRKDNVQRGVAALEDCVRANPLFPDAWLRLGIANQMAGRIDAAAAAFETQIRLTPGDGVARRLLEIIRAPQAGTSTSPAPTR